MKTHNNNFDLIRLFAALSVAIGYTIIWLQIEVPNTIWNTLRILFSGVPVFFVLSGFLVTQSWLQRRGHCFQYFFNRGLRIYPALWLQYVAVSVLMYFTGGLAVEALSETLAFKWFLSAAFIGSNFWGNVVTNYDPFVWTGLYKWYPADVLWTIPVEISFYLLVPLIFFGGRRFSLVFAILLFSGSLLEAVLVAKPMMLERPNETVTGMLHSSILPYLWIFLTGAIPALCWSQLHHYFVGKVKWWLLATLVLACISFAVDGTTNLPYRTPNALTIIRVLVLAGTVISFAFSCTKASLWLTADISYGLYLFHLPLPYGLFCLGIKGDWWLGSLCLVVALLLATASWYLVEKPALRLKERFGKVGGAIS